MIEAKFRFLEVERKGLFAYAMKLCHAVFCKAPKAFDAVDVVRSDGKFVVAVKDAKMTFVAEVDQAIVATPSIGVNRRIQFGMPANHRLQSGSGDIRHDLSVDFVIAFEQAEHDGFAARSAPAAAAHAARAKVRFIGF